ncbi:glycosyltransferase 87 family protein [Arthrobacter sp. Br18]|uniref:glycosyltransferase 87 family protein n=1 Tax=Arthrobacter sp. Br18 TaxID=1312954 RepID=UPI000684AEFF|nr:glycosyltransferase 87 family protein [Arthrobacter sp. Br18]
MSALRPAPDVPAPQRIAVFATFTAVHSLFFAHLVPYFADGSTYGDVILYRHWAIHGLTTGIWQGIDTAWVYPAGAMLPMVLPALAGPESYMLVWFLLCTVLNFCAVWALVRIPAARYGWQAAVLWMVLTAVLGPLAFSRVDGITGPLVVIGLLFAGTRPALASVILSAATWIKVWPAAAVFALLVAGRAQVRVLLAGFTVSAVLAAGVAAGGDVRNLFGFVTAQEERGMQLEAPLSTPGLWQAVIGRGTSVVFNDEIDTMELRGSLAEPVGSLMNPLLGGSLVLVGALMVAARRANADPGKLLTLGTLALVGVMIVFNKVGSPQFILWLAAAIAVGVAIRGREWAFPAVLMVAISILTTLVYPLLYEQLYRDLEPGVALLLSVRNLLVVIVFGWAVRQLIELRRRSGVTPVLHRP